MTEFEQNELYTAIVTMLDSIRPNSIKARVLEAMANRQGNGLPGMTYDLELANAEFSKTILPGDEPLSVRTIWHLIGLDVAPSGMSFFDKMRWADDNYKSISTAIYSLKDDFRDINPEDEQGRPMELYLFNPKAGREMRNSPITVSTFTREYRNAAEYSVGRINNQLTTRTEKAAVRMTLMGKDRNEIAKQIAGALRRASSTIPELDTDQIGHKLLSSD